MPKIRTNFREWQKEVYHHPAKFKGLYASRRAGKTAFMKTRAVIGAVEKHPISEIDRPAVLIAGENLKWTKEVYGFYLKKKLEEQMKTHTYNQTAGLFLPVRPEWPVVKLAGYRGIDEAVRGLKLAGAILDEVQSWGDIEHAWGRVVYPALLDSGGWAVASGTSKGKNNPLYQLWSLFDDAPAGKGFMFDCYTSGLFTPEQLTESRYMAGKKGFAMEFECSLDVVSHCLLSSFNGAIHCFAQRKFDRAAYNSVILSVDFGTQNPAFAVCGIKNGCFDVLETWEPSIATYDQLIENIASACKSYAVDAVYAPDDQIPLINQIIAYGEKNGIRGMVRCEQVSRGKLGVERSYAILNSLFSMGRMLLSSHLETLRTEIQELQDDGTGKPVTTSTTDEVTGKKRPVRRHVIDCLRYGPAYLAWMHPDVFTIPEYLSIPQGPVNRTFERVLESS
jgi:hypothetical protein